MSQLAVDDRPPTVAQSKAGSCSGDTLQRFRVRGVDTAVRLGTWSSILADTHLLFEIRATSRTPTRFRGAVTRRTIGGLTLVDCAAGPFLGRRDRTLTDAPRAHEHVLGFQFVAGGVETVREGTRELALRSGDMVLWDGIQPTEIEVVEPFAKRTMLFPRDRVLAVCPRLAAIEVLPSIAGSAAARLLARYINALAVEQPALDPAAGSAAADAALELLRAAIEPVLPADRSATRAAMRAEITRYVRRHLQDPELGPAMIARAYAMSLRSLFSLFEGVDESPAGLIRRERLIRCHEDLERPNGGSVTEIAFRWGFSDAAHFSRVFKREYGLSPREARHQARTAPEPAA